MKKILLFTVAVAGGFVHAMQEQQATHLAKEQTVVALDLHGVVLDFSVRKVISRVYGFLASNPSHTLTLPLNPLCWYRVYCILKKTRTAEAIYDTLMRDYYPDLKHSKTEFLKLCNPYDVNPEMAQLIKELKQKNYRVAVCSNIGEQAFETFRPEYSTFFDQFDVIGLSAAPHYLRKPDQEFFKAFKEKCQQALGQEKLHFVFADDKNKNAKAAEQAGMVGLVFRNPLAFRAALKQRGFEIN